MFILVLSYRNYQVESILLSPSSTAYFTFPHHSPDLTSYLTILSLNFLTTEGFLFTPLSSFTNAGDLLAFLVTIKSSKSGSTGPTGGVGNVLTRLTVPPRLLCRG